MGSELLSEPEIVRDYLVELLEGKGDLAGAKILSRRVANLQAEIETSLERDGLLALVLIPTLKPAKYQSGTLLCDPANIVVRVTENPTFNKSGKSALYLATRVAAALQLHKPPFPFCGEIIVDDLRELNILTADPEKEDENEYAGWDVLAHTRLSIAPRATTN